MRPRWIPDTLPGLPQEGHKKVAGAIEETSMIGCLEPGCGLVAVFRGRCRKHYDQMRRDVKLGLTYWDREIAAGRALPSPGVKQWKTPERFSGEGRDRF